MGYIVDERNNQIRSIVLATAAVATLAGSGVAGFLDNANGMLARFNWPYSAVLHPSGVLYVAGYNDNRIRRVDVSSTAVSTLAGSGAGGGGNGVGTLASFSQPAGITLDATFSTLYVAEIAGHRIRSITLSTALVQTIAGSGAPSYADGYGVAALFKQPIFVASSPHGILYTSDDGNN